MGEIRVDPRQQFSKKLARWTAIFWFIYMVWLSGVMVLRPATAQYVVYMSIIVTFVMVLNVWAYTRNSIYEKGLVAMLERTKLELRMGKSQKGGEADEESVTEGETNG